MSVVHLNGLSNSPKFPPLNVYIDKVNALPNVMAKSYMKVKINGKWCWKACPTPFAEYQARALCECCRCNSKVGSS